MSPQKRVHLLPVYDEYLVAYRDRVAVPHGMATVPSGGGPVLFQHALVIGGQVTGTWRTHASAAGVEVDVYPLSLITTSLLWLSHSAMDVCICSGSIFHDHAKAYVRARRAAQQHSGMICSLRTFPF